MRASGGWVCEVRMADSLAVHTVGARGRLNRPPQFEVKSTSGSPQWQSSHRVAVVLVAAKKGEVPEGSHQPKLRLEAYSTTQSQQSDVNPPGPALMLGQ